MLQRVNLWAGSVLILFGGAVIGIGSSLPQGTLTRMGAGFMPFWLAVIVVVFGCIILLEGIWKDERVSIPLHDLRPAFFVTLAIILFAILIESAGFLISAFLVSVTATLASPEQRWRRNLIQSGLIALGSALLFLGVLQINLPLLPR
ncbi:tripartite tricarboxylate transporter TctB family protein [Microvirga sp. VF16]|uniref:tripartite tricarboxylate transporter TctB family protein n=1 Tax=Microvirga sp. VF16 TaxID=2807101 RepID=UPI001FEF34EE|nr:tripartite tricarboxylate transporter TctB family protein [Microvirga sp. VF16]